jgi:hypothetical protein
MTRIRNWAVPALGALACVGVALPLIAQTGGGKADDLSRAKKMAELITTGQLNLRDATALAEKHVKGVALGAECEVVIGDAAPPRGQGGGPQDSDPQRDPGGEGIQPSAGERIEYQICCFSDGKIQSVRIDGLSKKVVDVKEKQKLD